MAVGIKRFCPKLYKENNEVGIKTAMSLLNYLGYNTLDTQEAYRDRDFIVGDESVVWKVEAERSNNWLGIAIPTHWYGISVPYRKKHSGADIYVLCNKDLTAVAVCRMEDVKASGVVERFVNLSQIYESFFNVPFDAFDVFVVEDGVWSLAVLNKNVLNVETVTS